jgi:hypothetical protein
MEKPVELMAFELGKEVMDTLRTRHTHISSILEVILQELGALALYSAPYRNPALNVVLFMSSKVHFGWASSAVRTGLHLTEVPGPIRKIINFAGI